MEYFWHGLAFGAGFTIAALLVVNMLVERVVFQRNPNVFKTGFQRGWDQAWRDLHSSRSQEGREFFLMFNRTEYAGYTAEDLQRRFEQL